jgi:peroxiredoxin
MISPVNTYTAADEVNQICKTNTLPVLQDTEEEFVWGLYNASKDNTFIIDRNGYIAKFYDFIQLQTPENMAEILQTMKDLHGEPDEVPVI